MSPGRSLATMMRHHGADLYRHAVGTSRAVFRPSVEAM
jgi:hypothetical protein